MTLVMLAIGSVLVLEGLALALAPSRVEQVLAFLAGLGLDQRRIAGLVAVTAGVLLLALARGIGLEG